MVNLSPRQWNFVKYPKAPAIIAVVLIGLYGVLKVSGVPSTISSSPGFWGGLAFLTVFLLALYLQIKQVRTSESFLDKWFSIFFDVIFAAAIAWYFSSVGLITAPPGASDFPIAFSVGVVILAVELISNSVGVAEDVQNNIQRMEDAANTMEQASKQIDRYKEVLSETIYGPALHSALDVRMDELMAQRDNDVLMAQAIRAGIDNTRQWIAIGSRLSINSAHRQSWWGLMETYHREERYDIARQEVVTNARNYAFIVLRIIEEFLEAAGQNTVVVGQVTPFSPKDFYNYPNGSSDNRFYHDAEFFGTYRRGLSYLVKHPGVQVRRIVLCAWEEQSRDLGWSLDHVLKVIVGARYMHVIPTAVPVRLDPSGRKSNQEDVKNLLASSIAWSDPAGRLRKPYKWVPVYPDERWTFTGVPNWLKSLHDHPALKDAHKHLTSQTWKGVRIAKSSLNDGERTDPEGGGGSIESLITAVSEQEKQAWEVLQGACREFASKRPQEGSMTSRTRLTTKLEDLEKQKASIDKLWSTKNDSTSKAHECVLKAFRATHEMDEHLAVLTEPQATAEHTSTSSLGLPMGRAEVWLYWWLAKLEALGTQSLLGNSKRCEAEKLLPTVWQRFAEDVLGTEAPVPRDNGVVPMEDQKQDNLFNCFRLVALSKSQGGQRRFDSVEYMEEQGILPEFLLVGYIGDNGQPDWQVFLGAELSDPFHATRITLQYMDGMRSRDLKNHSRWFEDAWKDETRVRALTREFLTVMTADALLAKDTLLARLNENRIPNDPEVLGTFLR